MSDDPKRLRALGATDLERRLLEAGAGEQPSPELTRRMRQGLGLSAAAAVTAASVTAGAASVTRTMFWARISSGIVAAVVAGGVIGARVSSRAPAPVTPPAVVRLAPPPARPPAPIAIAVPHQEPPRVAVADVRPRRVKHRRPVVERNFDGDLRAEIALVDAARAALRAGAPDRALALLQRHAATYGAGTFAPEATALRIEALAATGRTAEARAAAQRFVADHPDSPLSDRVARFAAPPAQ
jgi:hypothetical protein